MGGIKKWASRIRNSLRLGGRERKEFEIAEEEKDAFDALWEEQSPPVSAKKAEATPATIQPEPIPEPAKRVSAVPSAAREKQTEPEEVAPKAEVRVAPVARHDVEKAEVKPRPGQAEALLAMAERLCREDETRLPLGARMPALSAQGREVLEEIRVSAPPAEPVQTAAKILDFIESFITQRQHDLDVAASAPEFPPALIDQIGVAVERLPKRGGGCRIVPIDELNDFFAKVARQDVVSVKLAVNGYFPYVETLFSALTGEVVALPDTESGAADRFAMLLRVGVARGVTAYIVGLPASRQEVSQQRNLVMQMFSAGVVCVGDASVPELVKAEIVANALLRYRRNRIVLTGVNSLERSGVEWTRLHRWLPKVITTRPGNALDAVKLVKAGFAVFAERQADSAPV